MSDNDLARAEAALVKGLPRWPTHALERVCGNLVNVGPLLLPGWAQGPYATLWNRLGHGEATELLKYLASKVLRERTIVTYSGVCPGCGHQDAQISDYDMGRYLITTHDSGATAVAGKAVYRFNRMCYVGPHPVAKEYEGDAE